MTTSRVVVVVLFLMLVTSPLLLRPQRDRTDGATRPLIVLTPHNEQIRWEFKRAFESWHEREYGERVEVVWVVPGGTSDIRRMLQSQFSAALKNGAPVGGTADLLFGGGEYEHAALKKGVTLRTSEGERTVSISEPVSFEVEWLEKTYGPNSIGRGQLYDPDGYWFGTAVSSFGIVYNNDVLLEAGLPPPRSWSDLCDPRYSGLVAMADPGQSGSIRKIVDTILQHFGWREGWRVLRRIAANARYFASASNKGPIDVSRGDAAAGVCIDFFGRFQMQVIADAGDSDRLGYIDPYGQTTVDADPISMLRNPPDRELSRRFIEFALSREGQALWQFPRRQGPRDIGPIRFELRRLPIRRSMYADDLQYFIDRVDPFEFASTGDSANPEYWSFVAVVFAAIGMDTHEELVEAWEAIVAHPEYPEHAGLVSAQQVGDPELRRMLDAFDAMPTFPTPDGRVLYLDDDSNLPDLRTGWLENGWTGTGLWAEETSGEETFRARAAEFFRSAYRDVLEFD